LYKWKQKQQQQRHKYILDAYYLLANTVLEAGDKAVNKKEKGSCLHRS
jgi:hypothetical protein